MADERKGQVALKTEIILRHCKGCDRTAPMRRLIYDTVWICQWCHHHDDEAQATEKIDADVPKPYRT
jgi:ribosomal protein L37AE/L43A